MYNRTVWFDELLKLEICPLLIDFLQIDVGNMNTNVCISGT